MREKLVVLEGDREKRKQSIENMKEANVRMQKEMEGRQQGTAAAKSSSELAKK